ncbi:Hypothetical protein PBC10988_35000 [Planctomycetales bacterium 10988]|nr:Hypothetical protein PBC10988_35000 [Planctomycetales bacterium 10988]
MSIDYPQNTVWYVEGHDAYGQVVTSGSAVAVRLRHGDDPAETYLLTCSHVVRGLSSDRQKGHGEILSSIKVWPPGRGFDDDDGIAAHIQQDAKATNLNDVPVDKRLNVTDDWLLLRIDDDTSCRGADTVVWAEAISNDQPVSVLGYPTGRDSFVDNNIIPTKSPQNITIRSQSNGVVQLTGSVTEPGMSGGGVFDEHGNFVGLHRANYKGAIQLHGVYAPKIRQWLGENDYLVVSEAPRLPDAEEADTEQADVAELTVSQIQAISEFMLTREFYDAPSGTIVNCAVGTSLYVRLAPSAFVSDPMQRLQLKGDLELLRVQLAAIQGLRRRQTINPTGPVAYEILIQEQVEASTSTEETIRERVSLFAEKITIFKRPIVTRRSKS